MPSSQCPWKAAANPLTASTAAATAASASSSIRGSSASPRRARFHWATRGLVAVGVAAPLVDGAEHRGRVEHVHERARAVVDGLAGDRHVVGVHHAVHEPDEHPAGHQLGLRGDDAPVQLQVRVRPRRRRRGGGGRWRSRRGRAARRGRRWRRRTGTCPPAGGSRPPGRAPRRAGAVSRGTCSPVATTDKRPRGRDPERVHRLADEVLAQHRARPRPCRRRRGRTVCAPTPSGAGRAGGPCGRRPRRAAAPGRRRAGAVAAELVARVGLRDRRDPLRQLVAGQQRHARGRPQRGGVETQLVGQLGR